MNFFFLFLHAIMVKKESLKLNLIYSRRIIISVFIELNFAVILDDVYNTQNNMIFQSENTKF